MQSVFEKIVKDLGKKAKFHMEFSKAKNISRENRVEHLKQFRCYQDAIEMVKQAEAECCGGWIPCSERLPEEYGDYLVAWKPLYMSAEDIIKKVGRAIPHFYEILEYDPDDEALWIGSIEQAQGEYEIIAWQPLPQPYQPKGE